MERSSKQGMDFEATAAALSNAVQGASSTVRTAAAVEAGRYTRSFPLHSNTNSVPFQLNCLPFISGNREIVKPHIGGTFY